MAEDRKRGFGALEKRIHEIHEETEKRDERSAGTSEQPGQAPRTEPSEKRREPPKKK